MREQFIKVASARRLDITEIDGHWKSTVTQLAWDFWVAAKVTPHKEFVLLPREAAREVLQACIGPAHHIRELQALYDCAIIPNALRDLVEAFNDQQKFFTLLEKSYDKPAQEVHSEEAGTDNLDGRGTGDLAPAVSGRLGSSSSEVQCSNSRPCNSD